MSLPHFQTDPNIILPAAYLREYQVSISPLLVESWETDQYPINPKKRLKPHYIPLFRNKVIQPNMLLVMCIYLSCLSIYLSVYLSIYLSVCLSIYLSIYLSFFLSIDRSISILRVPILSRLSSLSILSILPNLSYPIPDLHFCKRSYV